jgi:hypothetical protein
MATSYTDVNPDPVASGIVQSFAHGGEFVYSQVAPIRSVPGKKFRFAKWDFGDMVAAHHETKMPDNGPANVREHRGLTFDTDTCVAHGLVEEWGDTERKESAFMNMEADHENAIWEDIVNELGIGMESELKTALEAASNATTLTTTQQWDDSSAVILPTFDLAILGMRHACGLNPNIAIVPEDCFNALINDATVLGLIKYTHDDLLNEVGGIPPMIRGVRLIVPTRLVNSANPGATSSIAEQWASDKVYFMHVNQSASTNMKVPTAAYFAEAQTLPGMGFAAQTWRPENKTKHWTNYAVETNRKIKIQDELIYRLDDVLE